MSGGLNYLGEYISAETLSDDMTGMVHLSENSKTYLLEAADMQPEPIIDKISDFIGEADKTLFASYGQDWWFGVLYYAARQGYLGENPKKNVTRAGDAIYAILSHALQNLDQVYKLVKLGLTLTLGNEEFESKIAECVSKHPELEEKFDTLNKTIDEKKVDGLIKLGKRLAGGAFVTYATRGGKLGRKYLSGRTVGVQRGVKFGQFGFNIVAATWGAWMRCYFELTEDIIETKTEYATSWTRKSPDILMLMGSMITGDHEAFSLSSQQYADLFNMAQKCNLINEADRQAFEFILRKGVSYYEESK